VSKIKRVGLPLKSLINLLPNNRRKPRLIRVFYNAAYHSIGKCPRPLAPRFLVCLSHTLAPCPHQRVVVAGRLLQRRPACAQKVKHCPAPTVSPLALVPIDSCGALFFNRKPYRIAEKRAWQCPLLQLLAPRGPTKRKRLLKAVLLV